MEAVVSSAIMENNRFQINRKTATNVLCARTLPKQWRESMAATTARHHTYPRTTPPKRTGISCSDETSPPTCKLATARSDRTTTPGEQSDAQHNGFNVNNNVPNKSNGVVKLKGSLAREVADAWEYRVGPSDQPASADRVQSIFNDIELYPTKNQVFEMLVCARECARRKSLTLTFGEFCLFAAELRRCSRQTRQTSNKSEPWSQEWTVDKEPKEKDTTCKHVNGSEASPSPCEVFLGGSCNPTTWRSDIAIPMLNRMGITYFNPQVEDWSMELVEVEHRAKAAARALLFVLDCETRAVAASVEVAHLAAAPRDLLLVLRPYTRHQTLGHEVITDQEYLELSRARATLQEAVERRGLPAFTDIPAALRCAGAVLRGARMHPRHMFGHTILRLKRAFDAAGGRNARLPRARAVDALRDVTGTARDFADRSLPPVDAVDFETFCAAVAELAADAGSGPRSHEAACESAGGGASSLASYVRRAFRSLRAKLVSALESETRSSGESHSTDGAGSARARDANGLYNNRLRAYGRKLRLHIPKNGENRSSRAECSAATSTPGSSGGAGASEGGERGEGGVFTPGTERRLERLPSMLQHKYDVYLSGTFPTNATRPEEVVRREGLSCVAPRANDYTRMFSAPARRSAPAPPDKPRHDKKPRPSLPTDDAHHRDQSDDAVQLRERSAAADPGDRLSASDFYKVSEDITPQPFKGTYDEELLLRSRILLFAMSSEAPCFCTLVLAAHYLGLRPAHTVLLIQPMQYRPDGPYSEAAVKDYNRGRHYLRDLALRANVPVFDSTDAALACVLATLRRGDV